MRLNLFAKYVPQKREVPHIICSSKERPEQALPSTIRDDDSAFILKMLAEGVGVPLADLGGVVKDKLGKLIAYLKVANAERIHQDERDRQ